MRSHAFHGLLTLAATLLAAPVQDQAQQRLAPEALVEHSPGVEDIYVLRSLREERSAPGEFCSASKIGFTPTRQDGMCSKPS